MLVFEYFVLCTEMSVRMPNVASNVTQNTSQWALNASTDVYLQVEMITSYEFVE